MYQFSVIYGADISQTDLTHKLDMVGGGPQGLTCPGFRYMYIWRGGGGGGNGLVSWVMAGRRSHIHPQPLYIYM